ncbi:MAG: hypothetical protein KAH18_09210 [Psychromonas sp.]|nr:hypothetical protein [Psychromonas sp.]
MACNEGSDLIQKGDLIMNVTGNVDTICNFYVYDLPMKAVASDKVIVIRSEDKYIYDKLLSKYYNIKLLIEGTVVNHVSIKNIEELEV